MDFDMPPRIAALERDHRGYPIPFVVLRENDGKPVFVVNDTMTVWQAARERLCGICGQELDDNPWFVGGPGSALLNMGLAYYYDGPLHHECMRFAMKVCPHLAGQMTKAVELSQIEERLKKQGIAATDNTVIPGVPKVFMAGQAYRYSFKQVAGGHILYEVQKPFRKTEFWQHGELMDRVEGLRAAKRSARELAKELGR